jgi:hypothetical protein
MANSVEKDFIDDVITALETTSINTARFGPRFDGKYPIATCALGNVDTEVPCFDRLHRNYILQVRIYDTSLEKLRLAIEEVEDLFWDTSGAIYSHVQLCIPINHMPPRYWAIDTVHDGGVEFQVILMRTPSA